MPQADSTADRPWRVGFWSLIATQFQGAFSDNAYKFLLIFLIAAGEASKEQRDLLVLAIGVLFSIPFVLFSMAGGYLADRHSKRSVTIGVKVLEIAVMLLALAGLAADSTLLKMAAVFLMSVQSALFGPAKYGLLPELVPQDRLSWANGILELATFLAIILGTVAGGAMAAGYRDYLARPGLILVALAGAGLLLSLGISRVPAADPKKKLRLNFIADLWKNVRLMRRDRVLFLAVLGNTYLWFLAALLQFNIVFYGADVLRLTEDQNGYLQAAIAIGIGVGSVAAGYLSSGKIEYGLIPLGSIGISIFALLLYRPDLSMGSVALNLALLGFFAGFFVVPVNALIQHRPDAARKGGIIGAANLLSFIGIFLASGVYYLMASVFKLSPPSIFLYSSLFTIAVTVYVVILQPDAMARLLLWILTRSLYRVRVVGRESIPAKGGALFVCNHLSFVDGMLLMASTDRPIRFLMFKDIYEHPVVRPFASLFDAIPISSRQRPREMIRSLRAASDGIRAGQIVCIFAEGQITRIGQLLPFRRGFERIMKGIRAPIIPVHLDGVWGSLFSFERGRFLWKVPRRLLEPVTVSFGAPMPATATALEVRQAVQELESSAYHHRKERMRTLARRFVRTARTRPWHFAMADARFGRLRRGGVLLRAILLGRRLRAIWSGQHMVGILLPPSVPAALVNCAAFLLGKVPVNLNYTVSSGVIASCARQCGIQTVITSRAFLERVPIEVPGRAVMLEDLAAGPRAAEKLAALLMAGLVPYSFLKRLLGSHKEPGLDDLATVIFSSGSTGDPKGVMLTHYNIGSNLEQLGQVFGLRSADKILGALPFFHSFGFTGTFALPLALGTGVVYHPNPLDAQAVGDLVRRHAITFLLATPTFLQGYMRRCEPEDFGSLEYVLVGAEKLHERVAQAFEDKFGIRPLEAYGCTECSPAVTVNTRDYRAPGFRQVGAKRGKIGHPLPGVSIRIVDPETNAPQPVNTPGLLMVRGPNVMKGYLGKPETTAAALRDGWYVTGDIAAVDEDGFLSITDRLSRFSKIGGEMVPHVKIEEKLQELCGAEVQSFAVTGVPDEKKGERLAVLHTLAEDVLRECIDKLSHSDLPNLWLPRPNSFYRVASLPYLGTGKMDLRKLRELALELSHRTKENS